MTSIILLLALLFYSLAQQGITSKVSIALHQYQVQIGIGIDWRFRVKDKDAVEEEIDA